MPMTRLLFIIQHQTSELWMKLAIHELGSAITRDPRSDRLQPALQDAVAHRPDLRTAQRRLGRAADDDAQRIHRASRSARAVLGFSVAPVSRDRVPRSAIAIWRCLARTPTAPTSTATLEEPSSPSRASMTRRCCSARNGFDIGARRAPNRLARQAHAKRGKFWEAWKTASTAAPAKHWMLYELAEKLVDLEDYFRRCALQPRHHGRTHHRAEARHRRHRRRLLFAPDARGRTFRNSES